MTLNPTATAQIGKLTSLNPNFENISLSKTLSVFSVSCETGLTENSTTECRCQIYQDNGDFFVCYTGSGLSVEIEDQFLKENAPFKINSGEKIVLIIKKQDDVQMEYIFSKELVETQKNLLKRDRETNEGVMVIEKQTKFDENLEKETKCGTCKKMMIECASVVPCLHRFCIECLLLHLGGSQTCPLCGWKCEEFRKDTFLTISRSHCVS